MINVSEQYRRKALVCEQLGREASDPEIKFAWADIAIEWHALASRVEQERASAPEARSFTNPRASP